MRYRQFDSNDWWPYEPRDPATYNIYQYHRDSSSHWRADFAEQLALLDEIRGAAIKLGFRGKIVLF